MRFVVARQRDGVLRARRRRAAGLPIVARPLDDVLLDATRIADRIPIERDTRATR